MSTSTNSSARKRESSITSTSINAWSKDAIRQSASLHIADKNDHLYWQVLVLLVFITSILIANGMVKL